MHTLIKMTLNIFAGNNLGEVPENKIIDSDKFTYITTIDELSKQTQLLKTLGLYNENIKSNFKFNKLIKNLNAVCTHGENDTLTPNSLIYITALGDNNALRTKMCDLIRTHYTEKLKQLEKEAGTYLKKVNNLNIELTSDEQQNYSELAKERKYNRDMLNEIWDKQIDILKMFQ